VFFKEIIPVTMTVAAAYAWTHFSEMPYRFLITLPVSMLVFVVSVYFTGLCDDEKQLIHSFLRRGCGIFVKTGWKRQVPEIIE
jgi:ABC-type sugar transport system permease subunit